MEGRARREGAIVQELGGFVAARDKGGIAGVLRRIKEDSRVFDSFIKNGGIPVLVKVLKTQNAKILDYSLSILANAFLKSFIREETKDPKLSSNLLWILRNLPPGPTLHCRACRLVGNMCLSKRHSADLCSEGIIPTLSTVLKSDSSPQTFSMVIRAVRNIWESYNSSHTQILDSELIKDITSLLITSSNEYSADQTQNKYKDLLETCLKAIKVFLDTPELRISRQIKSSKSFSKIVELCANKNRLAFGILNRLAKVAENRPELGTCDAIETLIAFQRNISPESSLNSVSWEVVATLCLFSREAVNRAKIRDAGGIQLMLKLLGDEEKERYHPMLLFSLTQFGCDEDSLRIMIENGVVKVLVNMLNRMLGEVRSEAEALRRMKEAERSPECGKRIGRTEGGRFSLDFVSGQWSPSSSAQSDSSSPSGSSPIPCHDPNDHDEENYSPVCSDTEDLPESEDTKSTRDEIDSLNSFACSSLKDEVQKDEECPITTPGVKYTHNWVLQLLSRLTFWEKPVDGLANAITMHTLTSYIEVSQNTDALPIVTRIIDNHVYFLPLLLQGFVFDAQGLNNSGEYLRTFSRSAESGIAFGELSAILRRGQEAHKFMAALSVPFLLTSRDKLRRLLTEYGGLELIFTILADESHLLNDKSVLAICQLAEALGVKPTKGSGEEVMDVSDGEEDVRGRRKKKRRRAEDEDGDNGFVTFELDDGGTVDASRKVLCGKSEAFSAMLEGKFFEAGRTRVRLQNVSTEGLTVLCSAASGKYPSKSPKTTEKVKIEALLDAVLLADKFLMSHESETLTESSMSKLSHRNLSRAWMWARNNDCCEFKICCVKNFLTSRATPDDRLRAFKDFSNGRHFAEFLNDVRGILAENLAIRC